MLLGKNCQKKEDISMKFDEDRSKFERCAKNKSHGNCFVSPRDKDRASVAF